MGKWTYRYAQCDRLERGEDLCTTIHIGQLECIIGGLRVIGRDSTMQFNRGDRIPINIGRKV